MGHIPFSLLAYFLNAVSVTIDKFLLTRHIPDPLVYVFYFSLVSMVALLLLPFAGTPSIAVLSLASLSTVLWTSGAYFMFKAFQKGVISRIVPVIGTLIPLILLTEAGINQTINLQQAWAVVVLLFGLVFLTVPERGGGMGRKEMVLIVLSASLFAVSYMVLRQAYLKADFLTVFVWSRPVLIPVGLVIIFLPRLRKIVFSPHGLKVKINSKTGLLFFTGQVAGGSAELLLTFSVSLATPALVNSLQGVQYVFLFVSSLLLSKKFPDVFEERFDTKVLLLKTVGIVFIGAGLYLLAQAL